jgi:hypothetical protein
MHSTARTSESPLVAIHADHLYDAKSERGRLKRRSTRVHEWKKWPGSKPGNTGAAVRRSPGGKPEPLVPPRTSIGTMPKKTEKIGLYNGVQSHFRHSGHHSQTI